MAQAAVFANRVVALDAIFLSDLRMVLLCHLAANLSERDAGSETRPKCVYARSGKCAEGTVHTGDDANGIGRGACRDSFVFRGAWGDCLRSGDAPSHSPDGKRGADPPKDRCA